MGPQILLDKSTLQSLSRDEISCLHIHYYVVIAPILIIEILGDLKKYSSDEKSKNEVRKLADKIEAFDSIITANCRRLLEGNLLGYYVEMDGRPVVLDGASVIDKNGRKGIFIEEQPERAAIREWREENFSEAESILADSWRKSTRAIDLEKHKNLYKGSQKFCDWNTLLTVIESLSNNTSVQFELLSFLMNDLGINSEIQKEVFNRWLSMDMPKMKDFSPYGYYCLNVILAFYAGIANGFIGTKPTNRIDLEYILYLPFCRIFSSSDNFLIEFARLFIKERQAVVSGINLKKDLKRIYDHWNVLDEQAKSQYRRKNGSYPPDFPDSFTNDVWKKYMKPREDYKPIYLTPEREKRLLEHLRPMMEAIEEAKKYRW